MSSPLADRLRPKTLDEMVGQTHLLAPGKPLRNIIESGELPNMVFYGPPGVGKTTLASIIAKQTDRHLVRLNGTTLTVTDDGVGMPDAAGNPTNEKALHFGISNLKTMVERAGGAFTVLSCDEGTGTVVRARIPLSGDLIAAGTIG